jgi:DNA-binding response OmpR family regulator
LIAEDNRLIGDMLCEMVEGLGCAVIGPVPDLAGLMAVIEADGFDAALLDLNLADANVFPAASKLASRGVPFIVTTGGGSLSGLPALLARAPRLDKPFDMRGLEMAMDAAFLSRAGERC